MMNFSSDVQLVVDGEPGTLADLWKMPEHVQQAVTGLLDRAGDGGDVVRISIKTEEGFQKLRRDLGIRETPMTPAEEERMAAGIVAAIRAKQGLDNEWYREKYGAPFDLAAFEAARMR